MSGQTRIYSDSTCDLYAARALELNVGILPFHYIDEASGLSGDDDLFQTIDAHSFYDAMRAGAAPFTSQPSQLEYEQAFEQLIDEGADCVLFCISTGISGGYGGALAALERVRARREDADRADIRVVDALCTSTPLLLLVEAAYERRDMGWSAAEIESWANEARWRIQTLFMVDGFDALVRGGRVPKSVSTIGGALNVKPLLTFDLEGHLSVNSVVRGRKRGMARLAKNFLENRGDGSEGLICAIGDADCPEDAEKLAEEIRRELGDVQILRSSIGPTIGAHVGPNMLSCCFWGEDRRM